MKDEVSTLRTELGSVGSEVSGLRDDHSKLVEKVDKLKTSAIGGFGVAALEDEIDALKKADQSQFERVAALDTSVEEIAEKVDSLEMHFANSSTIGPAVTTAELSKSFQSLHSQVVESFAQRVHVEETQNEKLKTLTNQVVDNEAAQRKLEGEFTDYTEKWKRSWDARDAALIKAVTKVENEQALFRTALTQRPAHGLSHEELRQLQDANKMGLTVRNLESQVTSLQKGVEKQSHISLSLNQRFNNLTTESLAKQILTVGNKALPKFENRLQKVEAEMQVLHQRVDTLPTIVDMQPELKIKFQDIEESIAESKQVSQTNHDTLAKNFETAKAEVVQDIKKLETSVTEHGKSHLAHRQTTQGLEFRLDGVDRRLDNLDGVIEGVRSSELLVTTDHKTPSTPQSSAAAINGISEKSKSRGHDGTPEIRDSRSRSGEDLASVRISRTLNDSSDKAEDGESLLASFLTRPPVHEAQRQSPRRAPPAPNGLLKRKRSKRKGSKKQDDATDSDFSIKGRATKETRR